MSPGQQVGSKHEQACIDANHLKQPNLLSWTDSHCRSISQEAEALSESNKSRQAKTGFWISVLSNACGTLLAAAIIAVYGAVTGAIRANPRGLAAAAVVVLAGSIAIAYLVLLLVIVPCVDDPEQRKAIVRYELGFFLLLELAISIFGVAVYRWAGWSTRTVAASHIFAVFVASVAGLAYLNRVGRPSDMLLDEAWRNVRNRNPGGEDSNGLPN
jgi:hypothetical protein